MKPKDLRSRLAVWFLLAGLVIYLAGLAAGLMWAIGWLFD